MAVGHVLDLVYNPVGAHLPPDQPGLEADYKRRLRDDHGLVFDALLTITNMPIARFLADLRRQGRADEYQQLLLDSFNPATLDGLMCRHLISVGWQGRLFDCDFNQQLGNPLALQDAPLASVFDFRSTDEFLESDIRFDNHCFGCTAGMGSS